MTRTVLVLVLVIVGCGDSDGDDAPGTDAPVGPRCGVAGSATVTGTVMGVQVTPVMRATRVTVPGEGVAIVIDETGGATCGPYGAPGEHLLLVFCDAPAVRAYTVVDGSGFGCPSSDAGSLIEQDGQSDFALGTGGSITITSADADCVAGSFTLDYGAEQLTGSFDAVICP